MGFFYGLSSYVIHDDNEGLYAEIAREMLVSGHYIIPHLNGVPYIEKPPLLYWLILISYKLFGLSVLSARLVPSLCGTAVCLSLLWFCHKLQRPILGMITALILTSSIGFIIIGRVIFFDMALTAMLTVSLVTFYLWHQQQRCAYLYLSYIFLALAFLVKGLVAVAIAGPVAVLFLWLNGSSTKQWRDFFSPLGIALFFGICGIWLILACKTLPQFAWDFFINENWYRFVGKRIPMDYYHGPIYYYIPRLFVYLFPWLFLIPALFSKIKRPVTPLESFLWLWFLVPFVLFSTGSDKANYYMVVSVPPVAILLADKIEHWLHHNKFKRLALLFAFSACVICISAIGNYYCYQAFPLMHKFSAIFAVATPIGILIAGGVMLRYRQAKIAFICIVLLILPLEIFGIRFLQARYDRDSEITITNYINQHDPQRPVYHYRDYEEMSSVLYYLRHLVPIINSDSRDLYFGSHTPEAKGKFIDLPTFLAAARQQPVYVISHVNKKWRQFQTKVAPLRFCVLTQSDHFVLVTNKLADCPH